ncbi:hypothetical protein [Megasphaera cerevisiae]|uniref:hypothetical protein n=1 Tax=Megasphaera cerevisiae TaxID=39029 RepID=UPI00069F217F|nr:hypothetical protein [Megasphaera cerevisiae]OKY52476.1 hypothetical protein BSR42_12605 [Megasphaera cerevisiae]
MDYAKMTEDDITLTSNHGNSKYEGKNTLNYLDDLMHKQWNIKVSANTQINDQHLNTYGLGYSKETGEGSRLKNAPESNTYTLCDDNWFIHAPFDTKKQEGVELIGDYRGRWNSFTGKVKPTEARVTSVANVGTAYKNYLEKADHGFEQRLRAGIDARIGDNTNVTLLGSASGMTGVDTIYDVSTSQRLNHQRMDTVDVTQHANKWDFSIGRLTEPMGVTGYWFGKEYDGGRAVWTSGKNQVCIGYGDFGQSTGINDSVYTHATVKIFFRAPTVEEFIGDESGTVADNTLDMINFRQQIRNAKTEAEQAAIVKRMYDLVKKAYGDSQIIQTGQIGGDLNMSECLPTLFQIEYVDSRGNKHIGEIKATAVLENFSNGAFLLETPSMATYLKGWVQDEVHLTEVAEQYKRIWERYNSKFEDVKPLSPVPTDWKKAVYDMVQSLPNDYIGQTMSWGNGFSVSSRVGQYFKALSDTLRYHVAESNSLPRPELGNVTGLCVKTLGTVLVQDQIPPLDKAAFVQAKHQFGDDFGVQAWYLRSVSDDTHSISYANLDHNDVASFDQLANVIGLGATWRIGDTIRFSYEWGQNRTAFGRFMNGNTIYNHETGTSDFDIAGRSNGGTPRFWVARVDIGKSDTDRPGSWNAFADYKYFQHGSFFGGNGTEGVPDRYMDGIKSFTIGGGYVPAKDFLLEAFYTFGAKGIGKRDTLYGPENFTLGDYTRVQVSYKF